MPQTKSQILAEQQAKLDAAFINPDITDKRHLLAQLAEVQSVMSGNNPTSSGGTPADITAGIDGSADIDLIKQLLTDIKLELVNSKSIADILIQDSSATPRYFIRQDAIDQSTGTPSTTILNFDGSIPNPVPVLPLVPIKAGATNQVVENLYIATIAGTGYTIGDSLSNVRLLNGETGLIIAIAWYNLTSGSTIASPPPIANLKGYADKVEELLVSIASKLPTLGLNTAANSLPVTLPTDGILPLPTGAATAVLQADEIIKLQSIDTKLDALATAAKQTDTLTVLGVIATSNASTANLQVLLNQAIGLYTDNVIPTDETVDATIAGLLRLILQRDRSTSTDELTAIGNFLNDDIAPTPDAIASLKSLLRGFWKDSDPTATRNLLNGILGNTTNPNIRQLTSADSVSIASLPGTIAADIAAIRTSTARIPQFSFQLAQDTPGTVFLIKTDNVLGTSTNVRVDTGAAYTPVGAIELTDPQTGGSALTIEPNEFEAITTNAGNWTIGDVLTRLLIVNTTTNVVTATIWQRANGTTLTTIPVLGVDAIDTDKQQLAILRSIDNKTVAPTASQPAKTILPGFTSVAAINNNLLDASGLGAWTDVRTFQSCELTLTAGAGGFIFAGLIGSLDSIGSNPSTIPAFNASNGISNIAVSIGAGALLKLKYDLTGVNFVRMGNATAIAGNKVSGVFNSFATTAQVVAQIAGTVPVSLAGAITTSSQNPQITQIQNGVITASQISSVFGTNAGQSHQFTIFVFSITGALAQSIVRIEESVNGGSSWNTIYTFEPITVANGSRAYKSPILTANGNIFRIIETVTGTTPSINRTYWRSTINAPGLVNQDTRSQTIYNALNASIDTPAYGVIRAITVTPTVATPIWLQIHDALIPVVAGAQPRQSIRVPVDGLTLAAAYFGGGRQLGSAINPRITISTTANTYTPIALAANTVQLYIEAI
jgi:hypothetical protein